MRLQGVWGGAEERGQDGEAGWAEGPVGGAPGAVDGGGAGLEGLEVAGMARAERKRVVTV